MSDLDELVPWLRGVIGERLALARHAISVQAEVESGVVMVPAERPPASPRWHEQSSGVLVTGEGSEDDAWYGTWAMGDSRLTRFIADNDPETVIARCEADLAALDLHRPNSKVIDQWTRCYHCNDSNGDYEPYPCDDVRLIGYGYRFKDGYRSEWAP